MKGTSFIASQFPLNLASIAVSLIKKGYNAKIIDFDVENFDEPAFIGRLEEYGPAAVGISCYTPTVINGHDIARIVKSVCQDIVTIIGGPHLSALPKETMAEFYDFDIGVIGEGEETAVELMDAIYNGTPLRNVKGLVYRENGSIIFSEPRGTISDLDSLPFPDRGLLDLKLYKGQSHRGFSRSFLKITEIMTSRGCPNRCIFCASDVTMGKGVRFRSAASVKEEIKDCIEKFGFNHFTISDDTFTLKPDRLFEICDELKARNVTWNCNARVWPISEKILDKMASSGCTGITFGVESGSPEILKLIKKNISIEQVINAFKWSRQAGIKLVEADVIIGSHPKETMEDINMTLNLLKAISPDIIMASVIVPYPGTEVYKIMKEQNLLAEDLSWDAFTLFGRKPLWRTEHFGPDELLRIQKRFLTSFYFNPIYMGRMLSKMRSPAELAYWLRGGFEFIFSGLKSKKT